LIEKVPDINTLDKYGNTMLSTVITQGHQDAVRLLIEKKGVVIDSTAFKLAALRGDMAILTLLIEKVPDINTLGSDANTILPTAIKKGSKDIVQLLRKWAQLLITERLG
jgi:ankyrin repeat protein